MAINTDIILRGMNRVELEPRSNALARLLKVQGMQQEQEANALAMDERRRGLEDQNQLRAALGVPGADPYNVLLQRGRVKEATEFRKSEGESAKQKSDLIDAKLKQSRSFLDNVTTPEQYLQWHEGNHADPVLGPVLASRGVTAETARSAIQKALSKPGGFEELLNKSRVGIEKFTEMNKPTFQTRNLGGTTETLQLPGMGGVPQVVSSIRNTQSPESIASNARIAAEGRLNREQSLSRPFEVTGPDGTPILVQQDKQGNIKPVAGFAPKGAGTGKPLAGSVLKQLTEARDNAATISNLEGSFQPDFAGKGVLGLGAEAQMSAAGTLGVDRDAVEWWKNYRKQAELVERHALFGAALTPGEQASWRSADIAPGMDPKVIKRNLETRAALSKRVFENTQQDLIDAGHSPTRINAIAGRGGAAPQSGAPVKLTAANADTEYAKLPSGAEFIAPDGSRRRKP